MNYRYNGRGEQVRRFLGTTNTYTIFDEAGHWLADYDSDGAPKQQAIWLDDLPVGLLANASKLHYIEPDHLGSPRVVIDPTRDVAVWTWSLKGEAFGNTAPNQDPDGDGAALVLDMRFPGQRFDAASGLNQNYFRDYEAAIGRYGESDPIGLGGGLNSYAYGSSNPLSNVDPSGLQAIPLPIPLPVVTPGLGQAENGMEDAGGPRLPEPTAVGILSGIYQISKIAPGFSLLDQSLSIANALCPENADFCNQRYKAELATCRALGRAERAGRIQKGSAARCYGSAEERLNACLNNRPEPPFHGWPQ
ncbi:RhsD protein [Xanthomonas citri pv. glycines str. 8ra]|nr:RhsD protein [Xanthomonas citri pv. glycines str. 8ra]